MPIERATPSVADNIGALDGLAPTPLDRVVVIGPPKRSHLMDLLGR